MTFLARAAQEAVGEFEKKYGSGAREDFIRRHILQNFYAFELMMAPYAVGHLKMSFFLEELGHRLDDDERVRFYLTNTLDMEELEESRLPGYSSLADESHHAGKVKKHQPILVILGNPPYSGHSSNRGPWIRALIEDYKKVDGKPLGEKTSKWLQDDYVKFLRFAQWKMDQAGCGVVGMITNHSFMDNPTFRGMRQSLMSSFDGIFVMNLHGNSGRKEVCPDGSPDQNVFDIRQGVSISFFLNLGGKKKCDAKIFHAEIWGTREKKYLWLEKHSLVDTSWQGLQPSPPFYLFVPQDEVGFKRYAGFPSVSKIFPLYGAGMTTARDDFVIDLDKRNLLNRIRLFKHNNGSDEELHRAFLIRRKKGWSIRRAWEMLQKTTDGELSIHISQVIYRPFDTRWIFYHDSVVWRTAKRVMSHMLQENLALITARTNKSPKMDHFYCANNVVETKCGESTVQSYTFPLYLYPEKDRQYLFRERQPNLSPNLIRALTPAYGREPTTEQIFHYIYAVL